MNIKRNGANKALIIALFISILLNGILFFTLYKVTESNNEKVSAKEQEVRELNEEVKKIKKVNISQPINTTKKNNSYEKEIEKLNNITTEFIAYMLQADNNSLEERRKKLSEISSKEIMNLVAPLGIKADKEYSYDPTIKTMIKNQKIMLSDLTNADSIIYATATLDIVVKEHTGTTKSSPVILIKLIKDKKKYKVIDYDFVHDN